MLGALPLFAAATLNGCSWTRSAPDSPEPPGTTAVDDALSLSATRTERALLSAYDQVIHTYPAAEASLRVARAHHVEHLRQLEDRLRAGDGKTSAPPSGSDDTPDLVTPSSVPDLGISQREAMAALARMEREAAVSLRAHCLGASAALAPLLASIHAAETAHADLLAPLEG